MNTLIAYYSFSRTNDLLARRLRDRLDCDIVKIEELKKRTTFTILVDLLLNRDPAVKPSPVPVEKYDQVIFISPIWSSKIASPLKSFIRREKGKIRRYAFITVCGGVEGQKEKIWKQLTLLTGRDPLIVTELAIKDLPMTKEKRDSLKWNEGYKMDERDFGVFEGDIRAFLSACGLYSGDKKVMHDN